MRLRITYGTYRELASAVAQMTHGAVLVQVTEESGLAFDTAVELELVMPDGTALASTGTVLQVLPGHGVAVTVMPHVVEKARQFAAGSDSPGAGAAPPTRHERLTKMLPPTAARTPTPSRQHATTPAPALTNVPASSSPAISPAPAGLAKVPASSSPTITPPEELTHAQKIQHALHGTRDQRNAILRDKNRALHPYVLKNPQMTVDDVIVIAKNPQMGPEMYKQISARPEWFQKPEVALALARNPKVQGEIAIRALVHVTPDALRQLAKGGAPPHVVTAARKMVVGR